jgi:hypothetical protein
MRFEQIVYSVWLDHYRNGGASYSLVDGTAPISGYMVSLAGYEQKIPYQSILPSEIIGYIRKNVPNAHRLNVSNLHIGTWYNVEDGFTYVDLSINVSDKGTALQIARTNKQLAIYDVAKRETIAV